MSNHSPNFVIFLACTFFSCPDVRLLHFYYNCPADEDILREIGRVFGKSSHDPTYFAP